MPFSVLWELGTSLTKGGSVTPFPFTSDTGDRDASNWWHLNKGAPYKQLQCSELPERGRGDPRGSLVAPPREHMAGRRWGVWGSEWLGLTQLPPPLHSCHWGSEVAGTMRNVAAALDSAASSPSWLPSLLPLAPLASEAAGSAGEGTGGVSSFPLAEQSGLDRSRSFCQDHRSPPRTGCKCSNAPKSDIGIGTFGPGSHTLVFCPTFPKWMKTCLDSDCCSRHFRNSDHGWTNCQQP